MLRDLSSWNISGIDKSAKIVWNEIVKRLLATDPWSEAYSKGEGKIIKFHYNSELSVNLSNHLPHYHNPAAPNHENDNIS